MYINAVSHYLPGTILSNNDLSKLNGLTEIDIFKKSGIKERRKASSKENTNTMAIESIKPAIENLPYPINDIDLIIGCSYTPFDTVGTIAHAVQKHLNISNTRAIYLSTACSSFVVALEVAEGLFATKKASKALIVCSEHNSIYNNEADPISGHLWGDGAASVFISKERTSDKDIKIVDVFSSSQGNIGKSIDGVYVRPNKDRLKMPYGKDVYMYACKYMTDVTNQILQKNKLNINNLNYLIPHQANIRIIDNVVCQLKFDINKTLVNIDFLGNTGCASAVIALSQNISKFKKNDIVVITVFGGGYSSGAALLKM